MTDQTIELKDEVLTEQEAADFLGKTVQTLRVWAVGRKGPPRIKVGYSIRYHKPTLREWLLSQQVDPSAVRDRGAAA